MTARKPWIWRAIAQIRRAETLFILALILIALIVGFSSGSNPGRDR